MTGAPIIAAAGTVKAAAFFARRTAAVATTIVRSSDIAFIIWENRRSADSANAILSGFSISFWSRPSPSFTVTRSLKSGRG